MFDVVHSDIWRPLAVFNHPQIKYYVFSLMITVIYMGFLMKERTEVFSKFVSFANEIKTLYSTTLKIFQFDNTLECTSSTVKQYLNSYGIIHEASCAYTPQRIGVAKCKHKHSLEVTKSLMLHMLCSIITFHYHCPHAQTFSSLPVSVMDLHSPSAQRFVDPPLSTLKVP